MIDEITNEIETIKNTQTSLEKASDIDLDTTIDNQLVSLPLDETEQQLIKKIVDSPSKSDLEYQFDLFNINQSKKNALRVIKLNNLLDKVEDQAIERFEKRPDQISNKELLEYMNVVSAQIDRAQRSVDSLSTVPTIHSASTTHNELNINVTPELDRDGKERVIDAINGLLRQIKKEKIEKSEESKELPIEIKKEDIIDKSDKSFNIQTQLLNNEESEEP